MPGTSKDFKNKIYKNINEIPSTSSNHPSITNLISDDDIFQFSMCCSQDDLENEPNIVDKTNTNEGNAPLIYNYERGNITGLQTNEQSNFRMTKSRPTNVQSNSSSNRDIETLMSEKNNLMEQLYITKGQMKMTTENLLTQLDSRKEEIRILKEKIYNLECQSQKTVQELKSKLEFKEISLHGAQQDFLNIKNANESFQEGVGIKVITISPRSTKTQKRCLLSDNKKKTLNDEFNRFERRIEAMTTEPPMKRKTVDIQTEKSISSKLTSTDNEKAIKMKESIIVSEASSFEENKVKTITEKEKRFVSASQQTDFELTTIDLTHIASQSTQEDFDYTLNISYDDRNIPDLMVSQLKNSNWENGCTCVKIENLDTLNIKAMLKLQSILKDCRRSCNDSDPTSKNCMKEVLGMLSRQFERLSIAIRRRKGSIVKIVNDLLSRKRFKKSELLANPQYSCLFNFIRPVLDVISKINVVALYYPVLVYEFVLQCLLPNLFDIINYFNLHYCCFGYKGANTVEHYGCQTSTNDIENQLALEMILLVLRTILKSDANVKSEICERVFSNFMKLLPLFATKIDLKTTMMELFCEMLSFKKFINWISVHNNDTCIVFVIMDLVDCDCLRIVDNGDSRDLYFLADCIVQTLFALNASDFKWKRNCQCTGKILSLVSNLFLNVAKNVSDNEWTESNKKCVENLLIVCRQLSNSCGADVYYEFVHLNSSQEFISNLHYIFDYQHPLLVEEEWPLEYKWFLQLLSDALKYKAITNTTV